jgi:hypothetical protein
MTEAMLANGAVELNIFLRGVGPHIGGFILLSSGMPRSAAHLVKAHFRLMAVGGLVQPLQTHQGFIPGIGPWLSPRRKQQ